MDIEYKTLETMFYGRILETFINMGPFFYKIGISTLSLLILYYGIQVGFFVSVLFMGYGIKSLLLIIGYTFPQIIVYLPVLIVSFQAGYWLCRELYFTGIYRKRQIELMAKYILLIIVLGLLLFVGALLETYVGSFFNKDT